ncbi:MAG: PRC-barrel domain-containing protein [Halobacteriales archaeon]
MSVDGEPAEITSLVGHDVYSNNGVYVGTVEDVQLNLDKEAVTALAVTDVNTDVFGSYADNSKGVLVPYRWVRAVGEVILVNEVVERIGDDEEEEDLVT